MDPTDREELVMDDYITFILNSHGELCGINKNGGNGISIDMIIKLASQSSHEVINISKQLNETLDLAHKNALNEIIDRARPVLINN